MSRIRVFLVDDEEFTRREAESGMGFGRNPAAGAVGQREPGDRVNLEIDTMARYAARLAEAASE